MLAHDHAVVVQMGKASVKRNTCCRKKSDRETQNSCFFPACAYVCTYPYSFDAGTAQLQGTHTQQFYRFIWLRSTRMSYHAQ